MEEGRKSVALSRQALVTETGAWAALRIFIVQLASIVFFVGLSPIYYLNRYDLLRLKKKMKNPFYTSKFVRFMYRHPIIYEIELLLQNFPKPSRVFDVLPEMSGEVLQVGCGPGLLNKYYRNNTSIHFTNLDVNLPSLKLGKRMGRFDSYVHADICKAPFPDETFDVVLFARCFHHIRRTRKALEESLRVLKPGGIVIVADPVSIQKTSADEKMTGAYMINSSIDGVVWKFTLESLKEHILQNMPKGLVLESVIEKRLIHMTNYNFKYPNTDAVIILRKVEDNHD